MGVRSLANLVGFVPGRIARGLAPQINLPLVTGAGLARDLGRDHSGRNLEAARVGLTHMGLQA